MKWIWVILGATALFTVLAATGVMIVGFYGKYLDPSRPLYWNLWLPILDAGIVAGALRSQRSRASNACARIDSPDPTEAAPMAAKTANPATVLR